MPIEEGGAATGGVVAEKERPKPGSSEECYEHYMSGTKKAMKSAHKREESGGYVVFPFSRSIANHLQSGTLSGGH